MFAGDRTPAPQETGGERTLSIRLPSAERTEERARPVGEITVTKSSGAYNVDFTASRPRWKHLTRAVRERIDAAAAPRGRWGHVVVHNSATKRGNAKVFEYYHRQVRGMGDGLAYHFVIGNGTYSGKGEVEVGSRWDSQLDGGHLEGGLQNEGAIAFAWWVILTGRWCQTSSWKHSMS